MSHFEHLQFQPADEFNDIRKKLNGDTSASKIDVSAGVYRDQIGQPYTLPAVSAAKEKIIHLDHDYNLCMGIPDFIKSASLIAVGEKAVAEGRVASCQTVGGTGACHLATVLLVQKCQYTNFYLGTPAWPNYTPLITHAGGKLVTYEYYDAATKQIKFDNVLATLNSAPEKSVFVFQLCCHNPTATDLSTDQWLQIADLMKERKLIAFFDSAYQGMASGSVEDDGAPVRMFAEKGLEIVVAQLFSKNLGLYGERIGCLHVVTLDSKATPLVADQLRYIYRAECSSSPAFGARIVSTVTTDPELCKQWKSNLSEMAQRLIKTRQYIFDKLNELGTPGDWSHVKSQRGLFWYSGLTKDQSKRLMDQFHVYLPLNGRVNIAGLNDINTDRFCELLHKVVTD